MTDPSDRDPHPSQAKPLGREDRDLLRRFAVQGLDGALTPDDQATLARLAVQALSELDELGALRAENAGLRQLVDLAARAADALTSTVVRPAALPGWWWDVFRELHRVGGHHEPPDPDTTARLERQVDAAYDRQVDDPGWWNDDS